MAYSKKTQRWRQGQRNDPFNRQARNQGWRSRAACKLIQLDEQLSLLRPGQKVLDCGSAPGSWSQVAVARLGKSGRVVAVDRLPMSPIVGVDFIQGDLTAPDTVSAVGKVLQTTAIDLLLSDMAPNITGIADVDRQAWNKLLEGLEVVLSLYLKKGGNSCIKIFSGPDLKHWQQRFSETFQHAKVIKPLASKAHSKEVYLFARGYRGIMSGKV